MPSVFHYHQGTLYIEGVSLETLTSSTPTPFYVYSRTQLQKNYHAFVSPFLGLKFAVFYAVKANANHAVIRTLAECGAGADITSSGELARALKAGIPGTKIIYSGVGKMRDEIEAALAADIYQFNVESIAELPLINEVAHQMKKRASIALRVNPNVVARTHKKISTGELGTKFGIDVPQLEEAMALIGLLKNLDFKGFQVHIGSHIYDYEPFRDAFRKMGDIVRNWRKKGHVVSRLNLGGGVGIPYDGQTLAPFEDYATIVRETLGDLDCDILFEPGRRLVGDAGLLVSRVIYDKRGVSKRFLILDAGMNDLVRPAMYDARHSIIPVKEVEESDTVLADVVGPICETSDHFGEDYALPGVGEGDLVVIMQAGAYGASMASAYNGRSLVPEIMVSEQDFAVVRRRISVEEQMIWETAWSGSPDSQNMEI